MPFMQNLLWLLLIAYEGEGTVISILTIYPTRPFQLAIKQGYISYVKESLGVCVDKRVPGKINFIKK